VSGENSRHRQGNIRSSAISILTPHSGPVFQFIRAAVKTSSVLTVLRTHRNRVSVRSELLTPGVASTPISILTPHSGPVTIQPLFPRQLPFATRGELTEPQGSGAGRIAIRPDEHNTTEGHRNEELEQHPGISVNISRHRPLTDLSEVGSCCCNLTPFSLPCCAHLTMELLLRNLLSEARFLRLAYRPAVAVRILQGQSLNDRGADQRTLIVPFS
jgi:hypothetical protein